MSEHDDGIKRYDLTIKVDGEIRRYNNVAIRREKGKSAYQLLTDEFELIDLPNVDWIFNHTIFDSQWDSLLKKALL